MKRPDPETVYYVYPEGSRETRRKYTSWARAHFAHWCGGMRELHLMLFTLGKVPARRMVMETQTYRFY